jgi:pimeloyl-ACP methyl ester carboxylesterase
MQERPAFSLVKKLFQKTIRGRMFRLRKTMTKLSISYKTATIKGFKIFYREAGDPAAPAVLLLHGFPTSSHMFRNLIPELAGQFRIIAPDLPGFGFSDAPDHQTFAYTFDHLAEVIGHFTEAVGLKKFALYVFDYGAPVGFRLALNHPERITALISQNGNAYEEGLSKEWAPIQALWQHATPENRDALRPFFTIEGTRFQYLTGVKDAAQRVAPEAMALDQALLDRPQSAEIQLDLLSDYKSNLALYPKFQEYFRTHRPPTLAVWGRHDPFFLPPGAEAYRRDNPGAKVVFYDTGHFALETHAAEIGAEMRAFLGALPAAGA